MNAFKLLLLLALGINASYAAAYAREAVSSESVSSERTIVDSSNLAERALNLHSCYQDGHSSEEFCQSKYVLSNGLSKKLKDSKSVKVTTVKTAALHICDLIWVRSSSLGIDTTWTSHGEYHSGEGEISLTEVASPGEGWSLADYSCKKSTPGF